MSKTNEERTNYMHVIECTCECHNSNLQLCSMCCHRHGYVWHEEHKQALTQQSTEAYERGVAAERGRIAKILLEDSNKIVQAVGKALTSLSDQEDK